MASRKIANANKHLAKLADKVAACAFCQRQIDEETTYGKLYSIGDIHCHYFCVLLSCCLIQKGKDEEGLFGFMYLDILAEIERSKKHKCSYCSKEGATLGCSIVQCKKQFHLPCGRERHSVSLFYGNYKSYCEKHAPKQKVPEIIMSKSKTRLSRARKSMQNLKRYKGEAKPIDNEEEPPCVCVICYEPVDGFPTTETFWPPCCARDAWFHRSCLQRMALSAGVHYLKCPLCNDKEQFSKAVLSQGYYIPDRDAAWELEQNAFSEIYERPVVCRADECKCPRGREYDSDSGMWDIKLCVLCGSSGTHSACGNTEYYVCVVCGPAAPDQSHLAVIDAVSLPSPTQNTRVQTGPIMPCRMSLRRTKQKPKIHNTSSTSQSNRLKTEENIVKSNTDLSREELNLKPPKRLLTFPAENKILENEILSPLKLLKQGLYEKVPATQVESMVFDHKILDQMREKFKKPRPLSVKRKIVNHILEGLLDFGGSETVGAKGHIEPQNIPPDTIKETIEDTPNDVKTETLDTESPIGNENQSTQQDPITPKDLDMCEVTNPIPNPDVEEKSYNSNLQQPPEFTAESSLPIIDTPKKFKKVDIVSDSMEISENNQVVNIDLVKVETNEAVKEFKMLEKKCAFKLSPLNKDILEKNLDLDLESFKNQYLNEVDRKFKSNPTKTSKTPSKLETAIDNAKDSLKIPPKRKLPIDENVTSRKRKTSKMVRKIKLKKERPDGKHAKMKKIRSKEHRNTELSIRNRNINLKIRFKVDELNLKITKPKKRRRKIQNEKVMKQYVLQYKHSETSPKDLIARPDCDVMRMKKKPIKQEKFSDNLKQTSIESYFKVSPKS